MAGAVEVQQHCKPIGGVQVGVEPGTSFHLPGRDYWLRPYIDRDDQVGVQTLRIECGDRGEPYALPQSFLGATVRLGRYYVRHLATHFDSAGHALLVDLEVITP